MNKTCVTNYLVVSACALLGFVLCTAAPGQGYTIGNGSMVGSAPTSIEGWDGATTIDGRGNGPFQGTVAYSAVNSPLDPNGSSGSAVFTAGSTFCSLSQDLLDTLNAPLTAQGQTLTLTADVAWDGDWGRLYLGFFEYGGSGGSVYDLFPNASVDIAAFVPADTTPPLDTFFTVSVTATLPNSGSPVRAFIGSSGLLFDGGANTPGTSAFALDNVTNDPPLVTSVERFELYR